MSFHILLYIFLCIYFALTGCCSGFALDDIIPLGVPAQEVPAVSFTPVPRVQPATPSDSDHSDWSLGYRGDGKWSGSLGRGNLCLCIVNVEFFLLTILLGSCSGASGMALSSLLTPTVIDGSHLPSFSPHAPACATVLFEVPSSPNSPRPSSPAPDLDIRDVLLQLAELRAMVDHLRASYTDLERSVVNLERREVGRIPRSQL